MRILDVDIYVVVYAVDEEASFKLAKSILQQLKEIKRSNSKLRLLYLVGNKTDLVRSRQVTTQRGRRFAEANSAIFFEVSAAINHLVDELLVDMVVQWRKESAHFDFNRLGLPVRNDLNPEDLTRVLNGRERKSWASTLSKPRNMLQRIFKQQFTAKSCIELQKH
ncbi:hypothetical protein Aperf_G00000013243 [Anoplocephala perfoliata]